MHIYIHTTHTHTHMYSTYTLYLQVIGRVPVNVVKYKPRSTNQIEPHSPRLGAQKEHSCIHVNTQHKDAAHTYSATLHCNLNYLITDLEATLTLFPVYTVELLHNALALAGGCASIKTQVEVASRGT